MRQFSQDILDAINANVQTVANNKQPHLSVLSVNDSDRFYAGGTVGGDPVTAVSASGASVAVNGGTVYVAYESGGKVYLSTKSGGAWSVQTIATNAGSGKGYCSVCVFNGEPYVAWITTQSYLYVWHGGTSTRATTGAVSGARIVATASRLYVFYITSSTSRIYYTYLDGSTWRTSSVSTAHSYANVTVSHIRDDEINVYGEWYESGSGNVIEHIRYSVSGTTLTKTDTKSAYDFGTNLHMYADFIAPAVTVGGSEIVPPLAVQYSSKGVRTGAIQPKWCDISFGAWTQIDGTGFAAADGYIVGKSDFLYLFDYSSASASTDLTPFFVSGSITQNNGSAISQFNATLTPAALSAVNPGTSLMVYLSFGNLPSIPMGVFYADEVSYSALSDSVSISARNAVGYLLSSGTYGYTVTYQAQTPNQAVELILSAAGVGAHTVQTLPTTSVDWVFPEGSSLLNDITKVIGGKVLGLTVYETPSGEVIVGADSWVARNYKAVGTYNYADGTLFTRQIRKSADPAYSILLSKSNVSGITPASVTVPVYDGWRVPYKAFFEQAEPTITTQTDFDAFVADLLARLQLAGHTENYTSPIRPQLEVGDVAQYGGNTIGIVTQVSHSFGKDGFKTSFSVDSGGSIMTDGTDTVTKTMGINGYTRRQNLADLVRKIAKE